MKNKHKMLCLMMAAIISTGGVTPFNGITIYAQEEPIMSASVLGAEAKFDGKLSEGDYFDIAVYFSADASETGLSRTQFEVKKGGRASSPKVIWGQATHPIYGDVIYADLIGVEFTGDSTSIEVEMWNAEFPGDDHLMMTSVELAPEDVLLNAESGEAIKIIQETINVVAGETQRIRLTLENILSVPSKKGTAKISIDDEAVKDKIDLKTKEINIPELRQGAKVDAAINLDIDKDVPRGIYDLTLEIGGVQQVVKLKVDSDFMPPSLQVEMDYKGSFQANTPQDLTLNLKNVGHVAAKNVTAKITGENVVVTGGSNIKYVENIASNETVPLDITMMVTDTSQYTVPFELELKYIDDEGKEQTSVQTINLSTKGALSQREVTLTTTKEPTEAVAIGETFNVGFNMTAPDGAENVTLKVEPTGGIVPKTKSLFIEPSLTAGQTKSYAVDFVAPKDVETGTYAISMTASYTLNGEEVEVQTYATAFIENQEAEKEEEETEGKGKPKVIVGHYETSPIVVKAGEKFVLDIGFLNTHTTQSITNFKANLTVHEEGENGTGSVFTPVGASNTFFVQEIIPGETASKSIEMYTLPNAKSKTYEVTLEMSYDDANGNEVTASEYIGIPVQQVTKLEVADVQTEMVELGMSSDMTAVIYNTGKTDISNVMVSLEGEGFDVEEGKHFEGLFEQGSDIMYMPTLIPSQAGLVKGEIVITYEDVSGAAQELRHPFEMEVMEPMAPPEFDLGDDLMPPDEAVTEETKPINWSMLFGGVMGMGIAAGITAITLKKRRKKLEELEFDED